VHAAGGAPRLFRRHDRRLQQCLGAAFHRDRHRGGPCLLVDLCSFVLASVRAQSLLSCPYCHSRPAAAVPASGGSKPRAWNRSPPPAFAHCPPQELVKHRGNFGPSQQERITELHQFAKQQRITRQRGPSAADKRRDTTTFEVMSFLAALFIPSLISQLWLFQHVALAEAPPTGQ